MSEFNFDPIYPKHKGGRKAGGGIDPASYRRITETKDPEAFMKYIPREVESDRQKAIEKDIEEDFQAYKEFMEFRRKHPLIALQFSRSMLHKDTLDNKKDIDYSWYEYDVDGDNKNDLVVYGKKGIKAINGWKLKPSMDEPYKEYATKMLTKAQRKATKLDQYFNDSRNLGEAPFNLETGYYDGAKERNKLVEASNNAGYPGYAQVVRKTPKKMPLRSFLYNITAGKAYKEIYKQAVRIFKAQNPGVDLPKMDVAFISNLTNELMAEFFQNYVPNGRALVPAITKQYTTNEGSQARTEEEELFKALMKSINANYESLVRLAINPQIYQPMLESAIGKLNRHFGEGVVGVIDRHASVNIPNSPKVPFNFWK
ncbi:MAG: hypothetical protein PHQ74_15255 [Crocinitomicaceae bacterium]|nr:hypothetical protein [Crocinitomicaceae bacterium]